MKRIVLIIITLIIVFLVTSCQKDVENEVVTPTIKETSQEVMATHAYFSWTVEWLGKIQSVVELSEYQDMRNPRYFGSDLETENSVFSATATELKEATVYYYRYLVWNLNYVNDKFKTEVKSFKTDADVSKVRTLEVKDVTRTSAIVIGEVIDDCGSSVTERGVCWNTSQVPTIDNFHLISGNGEGEYSVELSGLDIGVTYYVRAYAINEKGLTYGEELCFSTLPGPPIVTTMSVVDITSQSALGRGELNSDCGDKVTECGVFYGTSPNPTITGTKVVASSVESEVFSCFINNLNSETTYYICAFATNNQGTSYGDERVFSTRIPVIGAINALFSVSSSNKVLFSKGNLQHNELNGTWQFADNQYDYVGYANDEYSSNYNGWKDLFEWGTSGHVRDIIGYQQNKGNWRTLTKDEWEYLFNERIGSTLNNTVNARFVKAFVVNTNGVILFPDNYIHPSGVSLPNDINLVEGWGGNNYTISDWEKMEEAGCVFLPSAGGNYGFEFTGMGSSGCYWSSSLYTDENFGYDVGWKLGFNQNSIGLGWIPAAFLFSVRLVCSSY